MTFDDLATRLAADPNGEFGGGASEAEIDRAAQALGVPIVGGYRAFLRRFGWGGIPGYVFYGLGEGVPSYLDLVAMTQSERTEMFPPIPRHLLPIMNNGAGDHFCLDTGASESEPPIVTWYHEDGPAQDPEHAGSDFVAWLGAALDG